MRAGSLRRKPRKDSEQPVGADSEEGVARCRLVVRELASGAKKSLRNTLSCPGAYIDFPYVQPENGVQLGKAFPPDSSGSLKKGNKLSAVL